MLEEMIAYAKSVVEPDWSAEDIAEDAVEEMAHRHGRQIAGEASKHYDEVLEALKGTENA